MKRDLGRSAAGLLACLLVRGDCLAAGLSGVGRADPELRLRVGGAFDGVVHAGVTWGGGGGVAAVGLPAASGCGEMSMGEKAVPCKYKGWYHTKQNCSTLPYLCLDTLWKRGT